MANSNAIARRARTAYAVWELTLKCNLACGHCGSRAGNKRDNELSTAEALDLVDQMADAGITEVTIEGGEAYLRADWLVIARAITDRGMTCTMTTGGYGISRETARRMKDAGIVAVAVSVDGLEATHDHLRGRTGSFRRCFETLAYFAAAGIEANSNTQINRLSAPELPALYTRLRDAGVRGWQVQLTSPMGNGADRAWLLIQPAELEDLYRMLGRIALRASDEQRLRLAPANDIGYFGPYDAVLFAGNGRAIWSGCKAGVNAIGIHADGSIKGCPTLPSEYIGGNIRTQKLADILDSRELTFNFHAGTHDSRKELWGFCASCPYGHVCRAGCSQMTSVVLGRRGNNPYCHYRAGELARQGRRERIVPALIALGKKPFDHGEFRLLEEPLDAAWPDGDAHHFRYEDVAWSDDWAPWSLDELFRRAAAAAPSRPRLARHQQSPETQADCA
jgi:radical SAM protein with 4Fe4S-binding SPASM domain